MKAFIFDTETTGLVKNSLIPLQEQPRIIEFFGHLVDCNSGEVLEEHEFFCDPGQPLDPVITRITGIRPEDIKGQPSFSMRVPALTETISKAGAIVAHNLSFDLWLLGCEFQCCDVAMDLPARLICTVEQTEHLFGYRLNLSALHEHLFGEPFTGAHRARVDVQALTRCFLELRRRGEL